MIVLGGPKSLAKKVLGRDFTRLQKGGVMLEGGLVGWELSKVTGATEIPETAYPRPVDR
jgi:hypothetical protein